ncbi:hypothetical protein J2789_007063 [Variovorax paradoxus]|uniref:hypothetical protein n=1 Tax=Variovorax atrisoli TaxID=3394203 RepID=UPI0011A43FD8|nr:hypothetical protein [Variovorax paradoxus]MDR6524352.1 hypothetical protein [Variovorax paradoxus]
MRKDDASQAFAEQLPEEAALFDEEFLRQVDRAMLVRKQIDPHRLEEVQRAVAEESRLACLTNAYGIDRLRDRSRMQER